MPISPGGLRTVRGTVRGVLVGRFSKSDAPRVVGFDFGPPVPAPVAPVAPPVAPPVVEAPPSYPPPSYDPPAYAYAAPAAEPQPYAAPVATLPEPEWAVPTRGAYAPPPGWTPPAPAQKRRRLPVRAIGTIGLLLFLGRVAYALLVGGGAANPLDLTLTKPQLVGGVPEIRTAEAERFAREVSRDFSSRQQAQVGIYGKADAEYLFFAGLGREKSSAEVMRNFEKSFSEDGSRVGKHTTMPGDLTCATLTAGGNQGAACVWGGRGSDGAVVKIGPTSLTALAKVAVAARTATEAG